MAISSMFSLHYYTLIKDLFGTKLIFFFFFVNLFETIILHWEILLAFKKCTKNIDLAVEYIVMRLVMLV